MEGNTQNAKTVILLGGASLLVILIIILFCHMIIIIRGNSKCYLNIFAFVLR